MGIWKGNAKRVFCSWGFLAAVCIIAIGCILGGREVSLFLESGTYLSEDTGIFLLCQGSLVSDAFRLSIPLACTLPVGALFLEELQSRYAIYCLYRTTWKKYVLSKIVVTFLGGASAALFGVLGGIAINLVRLSFTMEQWTFLLEGAQRHEGAFLCFFAGTFLAGGAWALAGSAAAAIVRNVYMAYAVPFILYYVLSTFQRRYYKSLFILNPGEWMVARYIPLWQGILFSLFFCALLVVIYKKVVEKRLDHD